MSFEKWIVRDRTVLGASLEGQWLRLCPSNAGDMSLFPIWGTKIPHAVMKA